MHEFLPTEIAKCITDITNFISMPEGEDEEIAVRVL
jgi:hypothetical protein